MKKFWDALSSMQKVIVVIIALILLWLAWNTLKGYAQQAQQTAQNAGEMASLNSQGIKPSYTAGQYADMADKLYEAMDGGGTEEDDVYSVFNKLKNDADFIKLEQAFGIREATDNLFGMIPPEDLEGWIQGDMDSGEITYLNNMLRKKGITKTFAYAS